jgi:hypothetical protein
MKNVKIGWISDVVSTGILIGCSNPKVAGQEPKSFRPYCKFFADCLQAFHGARKTEITSSAALA